MEKTKTIPKLSTGQDSTLGNWRNLSCIAFGEHSPATAYLDRKIADSPNGKDEVVIADEKQLLYVLFQLNGAT